MMLVDRIRVALIMAGPGPGVEPAARPDGRPDRVAGQDESARSDGGQPDQGRGRAGKPPEEPLPRPAVDPASGPG